LGEWIPVTAFQVRWDPHRRYRSFVHRPIAIVTVVSSTLSDEAQGRTVGPLLIVLDTEGYVCDLEIRLPEDNALVSTSKMPLQPPGDAEQVHEPVTAALEATPSVAIAVDSEWMMVALSQAATGRWYQLGEQALYLFVGGERLVALAVREPIDDPDGKSEGLWLDELEGARRDEEEREGGSSG
jgi:hypothetical protein